MDRRAKIGFRDMYFHVLVSISLTSFQPHKKNCTRCFSTSSGLPQVSNLWFGVSEGMLPMNYLTLQMLIADDYCGLQLASRFGLEVPAYLKVDGATSRPGACIAWRA